MIGNPNNPPYSTTLWITLVITLVITLINTYACSRDIHSCDNPDNPQAGESVASHPDQDWPGLFWLINPGGSPEATGGRSQHASISPLFGGKILNLNISIFFFWNHCFFLSLSFFQKLTHSIFLLISVYMYMYMYVCVYVCVCVYIHKRFRLWAKTSRLPPVSSPTLTSWSAWRSWPTGTRAWG